MQLDKNQIATENKRQEDRHQDRFNFLSDQLEHQDKDVNAILRKLADFPILEIFHPWNRILVLRRW